MSRNATRTTTTRTTRPSRAAAGNNTNARNLSPQKTPAGATGPKAAAQQNNPRESKQMDGFTMISPDAKKRQQIANSM